MIEARKAGWLSMSGGSLLSLLLIFAHYFKAFLTVNFLKIAVDIISIPIWILFLVCSFYAVWGLLCGYNSEWWKSYSDRCDANLKNNVVEYCKERGIKPPSFL